MKKFVGRTSRHSMSRNFCLKRTCFMGYGKKTKTFLVESYFTAPKIVFNRQARKHDSYIGKLSVRT
jgi:hypothetical protein